jgi:hypothetical protein
MKKTISIFLSLLILPLFNSNALTIIPNFNDSTITILPTTEVRSNSLDTQVTPHRPFKCKSLFTKKFANLGIIRTDILTDPTQDKKVVSITFATTLGSCKVKDGEPIKKRRKLRKNFNVKVKNHKDSIHDTDIKYKGLKFGDSMFLFETNLDFNEVKEGRLFNLHIRNGKSIFGDRYGFKVEVTWDPIEEKVIVKSINL